MNRRDFGKSILAAGAASTLPFGVIEGISIPHRVPYVHPEWSKATPEQRIAIERYYANSPPYEIFKHVASSVPQAAPDAIEKHGWKHGSCRITGKIGEYDPYSYEHGCVWEYADGREIRVPVVFPILSDIKYVAFWRQAVRSKRTGRVEGFASNVPFTFAKRVTPGQDIEIFKWIRPGWEGRELQEEARYSLLKLQEALREYWEA